VINTKYFFLILVFLNLIYFLTILNEPEPKKKSFWERCCCCVLKSTHNKEINILNEELKKKHELIKYYLKREYDLEKIIGKINSINNPGNKLVMFSPAYPNN
jgi:hypothetical protein